MPHWPYFLNAKGDFISSPVRRSVLISPPGSGWPSYFASGGLGIEGIDGGEAAVHEEEDDPLDLLRVVELGDAQAAIGQRDRAGAIDGFAQHAGERHHAEAVADAAKRFAAGYRIAGFMMTLRFTLVLS